MTNWWSTTRGASASDRRGGDVPKYSVALKCLVPSYSNVIVTAEDAEHALEVVQADIDENGWEGMAWQECGDWEEDYQDAGDLWTTDDVVEVK